jgi:hypothetical protein
MTAETRQDDTRRAFDDAATDFTALGHHLSDEVTRWATTTARNTGSSTFRYSPWSTGVCAHCRI